MTDGIPGDEIESREDAKRPVERLVMPEFIREVRYFVLKYKDVNKYLSRAEKEQLLSISRKVAAGRIRDSRPMLDCVVVEHDWPEYEPTWAAIEKRVTEA